MFRSMEAIFWVERPLEFELDDEHVVITVGSGRWSATFHMSQTNFLASCAKAGLLACDIRAKSKRGQIVSIKGDKSEGRA